MRTRLKLNPGERGTRKLLGKYGDRLVCVRYRYDATAQKRYKTVELIVDEVPWTPPYADSDHIVALRVAVQEKKVRQKIKDAGGFWNTELKLWELPLSKVTQLGYERRIVEV